MRELLGGQNREEEEGIVLGHKPTHTATHKIERLQGRQREREREKKVEKKNTGKRERERGRLSHALTVRNICVHVPVFLSLLPSRLSYIHPYDSK